MAERRTRDYVDTADLLRHLEYADTTKVFEALRAVVVYVEPWRTRGLVASEALLKVIVDALLEEAE